MEEQARRVLAAAIVEALETGNPIAPLVPELRPPDAATGETVAEEVLDALGLHPCGIRLAPGPEGGMLAGPMLDSRLLAQGAAVLRTQREYGNALGSRRRGRQQHVG